jgi:hypothetical protein
MRNPPWWRVSVCAPFLPARWWRNIKLDAAARQRVLDGVASSLTEHYVYPEAAQKKVAALCDRQKRGEYDSVTDGDVFASELTKHLQEVSHDKHLHVNYSPYKLPPDKQGPSPRRKPCSESSWSIPTAGSQKLRFCPATSAT